MNIKPPPARPCPHWRRAHRGLWSHPSCRQRVPGRWSQNSRGVGSGGNVRDTKLPLSPCINVNWWFFSHSSIHSKITYSRHIEWSHQLENINIQSIMRKWIIIQLRKAKIGVILDKIMNDLRQFKGENSVQFSSVQSLSHVRFFAAPWSAAC